MAQLSISLPNVTNLNSTLNTTNVTILNGTGIEGIDTYAQAQELYSSWAILILIFLLILTLMTSYLLQVKKIRFIHETVVAIFLGMVVGMLVKYLNYPDLEAKVSFKYTYFFNLLLPPIILNSGYELERETFFKNIGLILTFAFVGTLLSTILIGSLTYFVCHYLLMVNMSLIECLMFGSILSSTDPVTVLAIFSQLKVDPKLYAIIFGESMLNDSVAIVLFETLQHVVNKEVELSLIWEGLFDFVTSFAGSLMIGLVMGLFSALVLKFTKLHQFPTIESSIVTLLAYATYFLSNSIQMSGIVSLLFCSIVLKHYAYTNLSDQSQRTTTSMFSILSQLSENFCFIYLGITLFTSQKETYSIPLILSSLVIVCIARYASIIPLSNLINWLQRSKGELVITRPYQMMLFWAGLKGAVSFALAMEVESPNASLMRSSILIVVLATVLFFGGTTPIFINQMGIKTNVTNLLSSPPHQYESYNSQHEVYEYDQIDTEDINPEAPPLQNENQYSPPYPSRLSLDDNSATWFHSIDDHILKPIFTHHKPNTPTSPDHTYPPQNDQSNQ